jgi:hypothetical protein
MKPSRRVIACALVVLAFVATGVPRALAQPTAVAPPAPPVAVVEVMPSEPQPARSRDIYDVGAGVVTVAKAPFNAALCGLGAALGTLLFVITFGSAYRASTRAIEEGCAQPWIVRGEDLRPEGPPGIFPRRTYDPSRGRW